MRIVIALGGNALLRRSDPMTTEVQRKNIEIAAQAIAPLAAAHSIVVVHGNGPQVGLLSLQADAYRGAEPYPLDVLDAGTQGMIGYLIQQELRSILPPEQQVATLLTMIIVDPDDPAFERPAKFVGPVYDKTEADRLAAEKDWIFKQDGAKLTEDVADALFEAGCNDGTPSTCNGVFSIDFHREDSSLENAIRSAIADVGSAGFDVARVEIEPQAVRQPA